MAMNNKSKDLIRKVTSKQERRNVEYPMWRKKIDNSIFDDNSTPLPRWVVKHMGIEKYFPKESSLNKNKNNNVKIIFNKEEFVGNVITVKPDYKYRLIFPRELTDQLKKVFMMSYMRSIETSLSKVNSNLEEDIPFWEFIDIEFDVDNPKFILHAHYTQKPIFPELFSHLSGSPKLKAIDDFIHKKYDFRIHKQDWKERNLLESEIGAYNVIYNLIDINNKLIYVGEALELIPRLKTNYKNIPHWTHFRYDALPPDTPTKIRVAIERMLIRDFASILPNDQDIKTVSISDYKLVNIKIDSGK